MRKEKSRLIAVKLKNNRQCKAVLSAPITKTQNKRKQQTNISNRMWQPLPLAPSPFHRSSTTASFTRRLHLIILSSYCRLQQPALCSRSFVQSYQAQCEALIHIYLFFYKISNCPPKALPFHLCLTMCLLRFDHPPSISLAPFPCVS